MREGEKQHALPSLNMGSAILPSLESKYQLVFICHCRHHNGKGNVWLLVIVLEKETEALFEAKFAGLLEQKNG